MVSAIYDAWTHDIAVVSRREYIIEVDAVPKYARNCLEDFEHSNKL